MSGASCWTSLKPVRQKLGAGPRFPQRCHQQPQPQHTDDDRANAIGSVAAVGVGRTRAIAGDQRNQQQMPAHQIGTGAEPDRDVQEPDAAERRDHAML